MAGIVGIVGDIEQDRSHQLLERMAYAVKHEVWYREELHTEQGCSVGSVTLHVPETEARLVWNEDQSIGAVMAGELYDCAALQRGLALQGHRFTTESDAELILHLYEEVGEEFATLLNGSFVVAIWERATQKLLIANDRMASYPLYYAHHHQRLIFAPNVHGLLVDPELSRTVDQVAIAQALTFDHILGPRTWLEAVHLMPAASLLTYCARQLEIRAYWTLQYADASTMHNEQSYVDTFLHYLKQAVKRQASKCVDGATLPVSVLLSGGLDSRLVAAVMRDASLAEPLTTYTWGIPKCDDARFAKDVARATGATHRFLELKPDYLLTHAAKGVQLTNGSNCVHYHALGALAETTPCPKVIFKGVMGDAMMGTALTRHFWADYAPEEQAAVHLRTHHDRGVLLFTPTQHQTLFTDGFLKAVDGAVMETYRDEMAASRATQMADQRIYFDLRQRIPRMTWNGVELVRNQAIVRTPFADNDVIDFSTQLPPGFRFERYLMKKALIDRYVDLAQIPLTENGLPLTVCARDVLIRSQRMLAWHLNRAGVRKTASVAKRTYADYDHWFRTVLRGWLEDILLDKHSLERGYFAPTSVRQLVSEQMAGANHAVKLGALVGLELWHRQFLD